MKHRDGQVVYTIEELLPTLLTKSGNQKYKRVKSLITHTSYLLCKYSEAEVRHMKEVLRRGEFTWTEWKDFMIRYTEGVQERSKIRAEKEGRDCTHTYHTVFDESRLPDKINNELTTQVAIPEITDDIPEIVESAIELLTKSEPKESEMIATFEFDDQQIRFVNGKAVANDVAAALGYKDPAHTVSTKVEPGDKSVCRIQTVDGRLREVMVLEEAGIYQLIFSSKLPSATKFKNWVTREVLPQIRSKGYYAISSDLVISQQIQEIKLLIQQISDRQAKQDASYQKISEKVDEVNTKVSKKRQDFKPKVVNDALKAFYEVTRFLSEIYDWCIPGCDPITRRTIVTKSNGYYLKTEYCHIDHFDGINSHTHKSNCLPVDKDTNQRKCKHSRNPLTKEEEYKLKLVLDSMQAYYIKQESTQPNQQSLF